MPNSTFYTKLGYEERLSSLYAAIIGGQVAAGIFNVAEAQEAAVIAMRGLNDMMCGLESRPIEQKKEEGQ